MNDTPNNQLAPVMKVISCPICGGGGAYANEGVKVSCKECLGTGRVAVAMKTESVRKPLLG